MINAIVTLAHILLVIGLAQRCYAFFHQSASTAAGCASGCAQSLRMLGCLLALGAFIVLLFVSNTPTTYVDYFIGELAVLGLHASWWPALIAGVLLAALHEQLRRNRMLRALVQPVAVVIVLLLSVGLLDMPAWISRPVQALVEEPQHQTAVVDRVNRRIDRSGTTYVAYLDGQRYTTPDSAWFNTLRPGATVRFTASAHAPIAFDSDQVRYAGQGVLIILAAIPCWALTFALAGEGLLHLGRGAATLVKRRIVPPEPAG